MRKKAFGIILFAIGIAFGYAGFNKISENTHSVELLGIKMEASDQSAKSEGYLYIGIAVLILGWGIYELKK